jgi:hypothetical protein
MSTDPTPAYPDHPGLDPLVKWGIAASLAALVLPFLGLLALVIGAVLHRRGERRTGYGIMLVGTGCAILGVFLVVVVLGLP